MLRVTLQKVYLHLKFVFINPTIIAIAYGQKLAFHKRKRIKIVFAYTNILASKDYFRKLIRILFLKACNDFRGVI